MRPTIFIILFGLSLSARPASAEALSRAIAVSRALHQNPQLAAARAAEDQARSHAAQVDSARLPTITLTAAVGPSLKAKLVPGTGDLSTKNQYGDVGLRDLSVSMGGELSVLQPIYTFGKIEQRARAAEHELKARQSQTQMTRAQVALAVAQLYEGLLFARAAERFFQETERWLERSRQDTQRELENETGAREQDILRFDAALGAMRLGLHQASAAKRQATAGVVAYLDLASGSTIEPAETEFALLDFPAGKPRLLIARARAARPELSALSEASSTYRALASAEAAGNWPDLFALLFASGAYTPGRDVAGSRYVRDPLNGFYPGVLVGARWQITGFMASERANENRAKARELDETSRWAVAGLSAEVLKAFEDATRARADAETTQAAVSSAKRWSVLASADYSVGLGDIRELSDSTQAYVQLRVALYDAIYRHNVALAELERATGGFGCTSGQQIYPCEERAHGHSITTTTTDH
ncbi:MAG: hypothetical protein RL701_4164 [Pseudomonadota bacterium]|jgi:outer membrane protein TolC